MIVLRQHATNDVFVQLNTEGISGLLGNSNATEPRIARPHLNNRSDQFWRRSFWTGLASITFG